MLVKFSIRTRCRMRSRNPTFGRFVVDDQDFRPAQRIVSVKDVRNDNDRLFTGD